MATYRIYLLNRENRVKDVREIDCADDDAAIARGAKLDHPYRLELWQMGRRVKSFEPKLFEPKRRAS